MALGFDPGPSSKTAPPPQPPAPQRSQQKCVEKGITSEMGKVTKSPPAYLLLHSNLPKLTGVKQLFYDAVSVPRCLGPPLDSSGGPSFPFISKSGTWAGRTPGLEPLHAAPSLARASSHGVDGGWKLHNPFCWCCCCLTLWAKATRPVLRGGDIDPAPP